MTSNTFTGLPDELVARFIAGSASSCECDLVAQAVNTPADLWLLASLAASDITQQAMIPDYTDETTNDITPDRLDNNTIRHVSDPQSTRRGAGATA